VLVAKWIGKRVDNGRVNVGFPDNTKGSLDVSGIKEVYFLNGLYYIVYDGADAGRYAKYTVGSVPPIATKLELKRKSWEAYKCPNGHELDTDAVWESIEVAGKVYCPYCRREYDANELKRETVNSIVLEKDMKAEVDEFCSKVFQVPCQRVKELYGGFYGYSPKFDIQDVDVGLFMSDVTGLAVVDDPKFVYYDFEDEVRPPVELKGRYIVVKIRDRGAPGSSLYLVYKPEGEPRLDVMARLVEEKKRRDEEEKRKAEEQERRLREEEARKEELRKRLADDKALAEELVKALPDWADGAFIIVEKFETGEGDVDIAAHVYPIKKSKFGQGYYYSPEWRTVNVRIPSDIVARLGGRLVTREGKILQAKTNKRAGSKYVGLLA
jgi:Zn ribbon nucleic-acid-binding protein